MTPRLVMSTPPYSTLANLPATDIHELVFANSGDYAIVVSDLQGTIVAWNPGAERVLGWRAADVIGRHVDLFFTLEDCHEGRSTTEMHLAATEGPAIDERWHVKQDGSYFWALGELMALRKEGQLVGYSKILRDRTQERLLSERLRLTHEVGGIGSFEIFPEEGLVGVSPQFCQMWGLPERPLYLLTELLKLVHPKDQGLIQTGTHKLPITALHYLEYRIVHPGSGEERWIARQGEPIAVDSLDATRYLGLCYDITDRKRAELWLAASEARFKAITHSIEHMVWTTSDKGQSKFFNERWLEFTGIDATASTLQSWTTFVHPDDQPRVTRAWTICVQSGSAYRGEFRLKHCTKGYEWVLCRAHEVKEEGSGATSWLLSATAIGEIVRARELVAKAQRDLQMQLAEKTLQRDRLWRLSHDYLVVLSIDGTLLSINDAGEQALSWAGYKGEGTSIAERVHPEDRSRVAEELAHLVDGQPTAHFEVRVQDKTGGYRLVSWTAVAYEREVYAIGRDVTDQRETQERLRQTQKMDAIGQLTGGIAHDFNNLLTAILGTLELMRRGLRKGKMDNFEQYLDGATNAGQRAAALTKRLLSFARRQPLLLEPIDVNASVVSLEDLIHRTIGGAYTFSTRLAPDLPPMLCDSNQLENALLNLVINARDAMPEGGNIEISTERSQGAQGYEPGDYIAVCVSDTGTGMPEDVQARAFEPFFTTKPAGKGTGLGLSMIYGYVTEANGHVTILSSSAEGTRICMYLPQARANLA